MSLALLQWVLGSNNPDLTVALVQDKLEAAIAGRAVVDTNADANYTLETGATSGGPYEWHNFEIVVDNTGAAWTAARTIYTPAESKIYLVENDQGAAFALDFRVTADVGVAATIAHTKRNLLWCDGTDMIVLIADF